MWFLLALGTAVFFAAQSAVAKRAGATVHPEVLTLFCCLIALPVFAVLVLIFGVPELQPGFWMWLALTAGGNLIAIPLFFSALERGDLSIVLPLSTLSPLFALGTEYLLLGAVPAPLGYAGVLMIVLGAYALNAGDLRHGALAPIRALARDPGAWRMTAAALIWSVAAVADRGSVLTSSPVFFPLVWNAVIAAALLPWLLWRRRPALKQALGSPGWILAVGLLGVGMILCQFNAVDLADAALVISVKRIAALFGVLLGGLFFQEQGLLGRLAATGIMVGGAVALAWT